MITYGWMRGYYAALMTVCLFVLFVWCVRVGPIHDATWAEDCRTLDTGGSVRTMAEPRDYLRACRPKH